MENFNCSSTCLLFPPKWVSLHVKSLRWVPLVIHAQYKWYWQFFSHKKKYQVGITCYRSHVNRIVILSWNPFFQWEKNCQYHLCQAWITSGTQWSDATHNDINPFKKKQKGHTLLWLGFSNEFWLDPLNWISSLY